MQGMWGMHTTRPSRGTVQEQIVRRRNLRPWSASQRGGTCYVTYRYSVLSRMPAGMKNLLVEVERVLSHVLPQTTGPYAVLSAGLVSRKRAAHLLCLERRLVRLQHDVTAAVDVEYAEVVMIRSRQHMPEARTSASQPTQMKRV